MIQRMSGIPNHVSFQAALARRSQFNGVLPVRQLKRLVDCLADGEGDLLVQLEVRPEMGNAPHLIGVITGGVTLVCQRCLRPYVQPLVVDVDLRPVSSEAEEARLLRDADPYLLESDRLPLHEIIEDEVMLALPMTPHCANPDCSGVTSQVDTGSLN
jgi:uncharacterized protein